MIFLHKPYIVKENNKSRLIFDIDINEEKKKVWFEVDQKYEKYLCDDRVDAIYIGMLHYAMNNGHDIKSDSYITEEILYKTTEYLIPILVKSSRNFKMISVEAKSKKTIKNTGAVATGCSGGIDSLYAIVRHLDYNNKNFNLDYLCLNNVGSFNECYKEAGIDKVRKERIKKSEELAKEINLPIIITDSNFYQEVPQNHLLTCTYSSTFAILCLQKLWGRYYYGSVGLEYTDFDIVENDVKAASHYDLLSLDCFSTDNLKIYSDGGGILRFDKLKRIYNHELVKKYLHVCTTREYNCGKCPKCRRELLSLYLLGVNLEEYKDVFDIEYFTSNIEEYFNWIYEQFLWNEHFETYEAVYNELLKKEEFQKFIESKKQSNGKKQEAGEYNYYKEQYESIINSKTYKAGNIIMYIPRKIKSIIKKQKS